MGKNFSVDFEGLGILGLFVGLGGALLAGYQSKKTNDMARKLDISVKSLEKKTPVQVSQDIVNKAVRNATNRKVDAAVDRSVSALTFNMKETMDRKIRDDVSGVYEQLKTGVADKVADEIIKWDMKDMQQQVKSKVVDKAFDKLCGLSDIGRLVGNSVRNREIDTEDLSDILDQFAYSSDKKEVLKMLLNRSN